MNDSNRTESFVDVNYKVIEFPRAQALARYHQPYPCMDYKATTIYGGAVQMMKKCPPIICDPQYIVRDCYIPREVPIIHPIVNVERRVIVNVPRHYVQPMTRNEVVDPGCPGCHKP